MNTYPESLVNYLGGDKNALIFSVCGNQDGNELLILSNTDKSKDKYSLCALNVILSISIIITLSVSTYAVVVVPSVRLSTIASLTGRVAFAG